MKKIIDRQRAFFHTGTTLDVSFRIAALKHLQKSRMSEHRWHSSAPEATGNLLLTVSR